MSGPVDEQLISQLESILLVAGDPVRVAALASSVGQPSARVDAHLRTLHQRLMGGIRLQLHDGQAQLVSAPDNAAVVQRFLGAVKPAQLSRACMETLTVIAYRQPVTRAEIEGARGVNSDRAVQTLLARELIEDRGQRATIGRPTQYGTTFAFLQYFGLSSLDELPVIESDSEGVAEPQVLGLRADARQKAAQSGED